MRKMRNVFIVTGVLAWLGGLGTALVASSCNVCWTNPDDPSCQTEPVEDRMDGVRTPPGECDYAAHPSVHVVPVRKFDDYYSPVNADAVWSVHDGKTYEAMCVRDDQGHCVGPWITSYELEGRHEVFAEYCGDVVSQVVEVGRTEDDCNVQTEFLLLEVSTRGCLTDETPEPPPPPGPWQLIRGITNG